MHVMWTFKTKQFKVEWSIEPEQDPDFSFDETGETARKVASGEWDCFTSRMAVYYRGQRIAADYLGNSIYANPAEFRDHVGARGKYGSYFSDMVRQVISEARDHCRKIERPYIRA